MMGIRFGGGSEFKPARRAMKGSLKYPAVAAASFEVTASSAVARTDFSVNAMPFLG